MSIDLQELLKKRVELQSKSKSGDFMKLEDGTNVIRVVSYSDYPWYIETGTHYLTTPEGEVKAIPCRKQAGYPDCFMCEVADKFSKGSDEERATSKKMRSKYKVMMNVIDRKDNKVKVLGVGITVFKAILDLIIDPDWGDMTDPKNGYDIAVTKSGKGLETEYSVTPKPKRGSYGVEVNNENYVDLEELIKLPTYEEQKALFYGEELTEDEEPQVPVKKSHEQPIAKPVSKVDSIPETKASVKTESSAIDMSQKQALEEEIQNALAKYRK